MICPDLPLASDPFGFDWNLLGTAGYRINIGLVDARFAWYTAVIAIVVGHIIAVFLAHLMALRTLRNHRLALRSQYPMLVLMVGYTVISLWILAQPIVESRVSVPTMTASSTVTRHTVSQSEQVAGRQQAGLNFRVTTTLGGKPDRFLYEGHFGRVEANGEYDSDSYCTDREQFQEILMKSL